MHFKKTLLATLTTAALSFSLPSHSEDLLQIYDLAVKQDTDITAARASREAVAETKNQSFSVFLPQVSATGNTTGNQSDSSGSSQQDFNSHGYTLQLNQSVYDHSNYVNWRITKSNISQADSELAAAEQDLIVRVAEAYFNVLNSQDTLTFTEAEQEAIGRQLEQAKRRYEVGIIAITDVHEAQAAFDGAVADTIAAQNDLQTNKEELRRITGQYYDKYSILAEDFPIQPPEPENIDEWVATAESQNLSLMAAQYQLESAKENISLQRSGHYPTLGMVAQHGYSDSNGGSSFFSSGSQSKDSSISLQLNVPIYEGGAVTSRTREAGHLYIQSQEQYEGVRRSTVNNARNSYLNVIAEASRVTALKQTVISSESALEATEAGFEVGTRTIVDVLTVQRNLYQSLRDYHRSRYVYIVNMFRLKQAAGNLSPDDLNYINQWLREPKV